MNFLTKDKLIGIKITFFYWLNSFSLISLLYRLPLSFVKIPELKCEGNKLLEMKHKKLKLIWTKNRKIENFMDEIQLLQKKKKLKGLT